MRRRLTGLVLLRPDLRRRTVRLRLTLLYGGLFLLSGAALLAVTYALVVNATSGFVFDGESNGAVVSGSFGTANPEHRRGEHPSLRSQGRPPVGSASLTPRQLRRQARRLEDEARRQHADVLHQLLVQSAIALGIMALASIALGWVVAGRVLRPLRTITAAAREISATNLHQRLALAGPRDELRELGDTFDALLARLEESFDAQRRFAANASHELRTPLARQRALLELSLGDPDATVASLRATEERVLAAGRQQERLIDGLLGLARGEHGPRHRERVDLAPIVAQALGTQRAEIARRGLSVEAALAPAPTCGDPDLLGRLVGNLVDNAVKHNVAGGCVAVQTELLASGAALTVANAGVPIAAEEVDRLLLPFQRLDVTRRANPDGFGLGLSIARAIALAHGATLAARPRAGGGLEVGVSFAAPGAATANQGVAGNGVPGGASSGCTAPSTTE